MLSAVALRSRRNIYMSSHSFRQRECRWKMNGDLSNNSGSPKDFFQISKIPEKVYLSIKVMAITTTKC